MNFDLIALAVLVVVWALLGTASWLVIGLRRRGRGMLVLWPPAAIGGVAGGALVPTIGLRNVLALLLSLAAAVIGGFLFTLVVPRLLPLLQRRSIHG